VATMPFNDGTNYFKESSVFHNLSFDKVFPVHPNVDVQYRLQKVIRGCTAYRSIFIAECVRLAMNHHLVNKRYTVGFIGCGAFAAGIVDGLLQIGHKPDQIIISSRRPEIYGKYRRLGVQCIEDNAFIFKKSRIVFLACLPAQLKTAIGRLRGQLKKTTLVVSILAGVRVMTIKNMLAAADEQFLRVKFDADSMYATISKMEEEHRNEWQASRLANGRRDLHPDDYYDYDSQSNVCRELVMNHLTTQRTSAHDGFYSIVNAIEFMLTRLGCGAVATQVAVESVMGPRVETALQKQIKAQKEELAYQERMFEENEPMKRRERQAALKEMRRTRKEIDRLIEMHRVDTEEHLRNCLVVFRRGEDRKKSAIVMDHDLDVQPQSSGGDVEAEGPSASEGVSGEASGDSTGAAGATEAVDTDTQQNKVGAVPSDVKGSAADSNPGTPSVSAQASSADGTNFNTAAQASTESETEAQTKQLALADYIRNSFERVCAKFTPQRVVTFTDILPPEDSFFEHSDDELEGHQYMDLGDENSSDEEHGPMG